MTGSFTSKNWAMVNLDEKVIESWAESFDIQSTKGLNKRAVNSLTSTGNPP